MARYIDAELIDAEDLENGTAYQIQGYIDNIPTADVVEVIHCKNCQYYYKGISTRCTHPNGLKAPDDSTWCSFGERK